MGQITAMDCFTLVNNTLLFGKNAWSSVDEIMI